MYKRNDLTKDSKHYDYIYYYEDMTKADWLHIREYVGDLGEKIKSGSRYYETTTGETKTKPLYTYDNFCCGFDIETSTVNTCNLITGKKDFYSAMYVAQYSIRPRGKAECIGIRFRKWEQVREFFIKLPKLWRLGKSEVILTYVHNLDYETSYLKHRVNIDKNTFFGKSRQRPVKYLAEGHIYLHDSYTMTNMSLAKLADTYKTKHQKALGDIDHTKVRNYLTPLSRSEERYIFNDVFILSDFAERIYTMYDYIPDTATQILSKTVEKYALDDVSDLVGSNRWEKWKNETDTDYDLLKRIHGYIFGYEYQINGLKHRVSGLVDPKHFTPYNSKGVPIPVQGQDGKYDFYQWLYRGGIAKSNARYTSSPDYLIHGVQQRVTGYDYTSSYPFVMTAFNYPVGRFEEYKGNIDKLTLEYGHPDFEEYRYIFIIEFEDLQSINDYCIESVSKVQAEGVTEDNGRIYHADRLTACLTDVDYRLYTLYYKWSKKTVLKALRAKAGKLPMYLLKPMWESGRKKQELKHVEGKETDYLLNKIAFNTYYGLTVKQPVYNNYIFDNVVTDEGYISTETDRAVFFGLDTVCRHSVDKGVENRHNPVQNDCKRKDFSDCTQNFILSPYWGIWTSAFARFNLLLTIYNVGQDSESFDKGDGETVQTNDTIYCDTDSLYFINPEKHKHIIDSWNKWVKDRVLSRLPEEYHKSLGSLGQFDNIALDDSHGYTDTFINFKTLGSKRYIKEIQFPKKKKIKATIAGLPKGSLESFCKRNHKCIYETFDNLMNFCTDIESEDLSAEDKVKLGRIYHDELMEFFIAGVKVREYSACTLYPTGFTLKMKPLYLAHIAHFNNTISGGKNGDYQIYRE